MYYNQSNTEEFIKKAKIVHGDKYNYSKVRYINAKTKICIICPEHGEFWQTPSNHLSGRGCPVCRYIKMSQKQTLTTKQFIEKARAIHGEKYNYDKVEYKNQKEKVCIICPEHGEFWQRPTTHLDHKAGCPKCSKNYRYTTEEFLETLPNWIKDCYDFSKFVYKSTHYKVIVICPEHGEFLTTPHNLRIGVGCPSCTESKLEREVRDFLIENNFEFIPEYKHNKDFHKQTLDFYLPKYNIAIECQGIQHFKPTDFAGRGREWAEENYQKIILLDKNKQELCKKNGIKLIYFTTNKNLLYNKNSYYDDYTIVTDIKELRNLI